jgi:hypothetical protein
MMGYAPATQYRAGAAVGETAGTRTVGVRLGTEVGVGVEG